MLRILKFLQGASKGFIFVALNHSFEALNYSPQGQDKGNKKKVNKENKNKVYFWNDFWVQNGDGKLSLDEAKTFGLFLKQYFVHSFTLDYTIKMDLKNVD